MIPARGVVIAERYELERPIASGGMGSVWGARHKQLGVPVAVKFMAPELAGDAVSVARFEREARAAAQLSSPHVVHIHDYGVEDGTPYIAMELLEGEDLGSRLKRLGRLDLPTTAAIVTQIAKALGLAHRAGIVHRDLKPGNVFMARVGDEEVVKVLDFGVAKQLGVQAPVIGENTTTGMLLGSPGYLSPEQARGGTVDGRSDLWSLGAIAFVALTGKKPFVGASVGDVIAKICADPLPVATEVAPDLPPAVDGFFARAFARNPDARFAHAAAMAEALRQLAEVEGSVTPSGPLPVPLGRTDETLATRIRLADSEPSARSAVDHDKTGESAVSFPPRAHAAERSRRKPWWLSLPLVAAALGAAVYASESGTAAELALGLLSPPVASDLVRIAAHGDSAPAPPASTTPAPAISSPSEVRKPSSFVAPKARHEPAKADPRPQRCDPFSGLCRNP
jgi:serine/threonine-protein kinase